MSDRRNFLKAAAAVSVTGALGACTATGRNLAVSEPQGLSLPAGIVYTKENPGKWAKKVGGHIPNVTVEGNKVTISTDHGMSKKHFIVRHTIVTADGEVLGEKTFSHDDDEPISSFEIDAKGKQLYATSFCNKHDMWVTPFKV